MANVRGPLNSSEIPEAQPVGGVFNTQPPAPLDGQGCALQLDANGRLLVTTNGGMVVGGIVQIEDSSGNVLNSNGSGALNVAVVSGGGSNPSVGVNNTPAPASSTEIGTIDAGGNLQGVSASNPLPITGSISASNPSVGTTGAAAPTSATEIGIINGGGNLTGVSPTTPLPISATAAANASGNPIFTESVGTSTVEVAGIIGTSTVTVAGGVAASITGTATVEVAGILGTSTVEVAGIIGTSTVTVAGTVTVVGNLTNNNAAPTATNVGALTALANAANPSWTEGDQVLESVTLHGYQRVVPLALNATIGDAASTTQSFLTDQNGAGIIGFNFSYLFNGTTWDRIRSAGIGNNVASTGLAIAEAYGQYNSSLPTITTGNYTSLQTDINGRLITTGVSAASITGTATVEVAGIVGTSTVTVAGGIAASITGTATVEVAGILGTSTVEVAGIVGTSTVTVSGTVTAACTGTQTVTVAGGVAASITGTATVEVAGILGTSTVEVAGIVGTSTVTVSGGIAASITGTATVEVAGILGTSTVEVAGIVGTSTVTVAGTATVVGNLTNNNAAPTTTNLGVLPALANATAPTWTEGDQVLLSEDLAGNLRTITGIARGLGDNQSNAGFVSPSGSTIATLAGLYIYNGTTWDRMRSGGSVTGAVMVAVTSTPTVVVTGTSTVVVAGAFVAETNTTTVTASSTLAVAASTRWNVMAVNFKAICSNTVTKQAAVWVTDASGNVIWETQGPVVTPTNTLCLEHVLYPSVTSGTTYTSLVRGTNTSVIILSMPELVLGANYTVNATMVGAAATQTYTLVVNAIVE